MNAQTNIPAQGVSKKGTGVVVFLDGKEIKLTKKELETFIVVATNSGNVRPGDNNVFGWQNHRQYMYHSRRLHMLKARGLIDFAIKDDHVVVILTELGQKVYNLIKKDAKR